MFDIPQQSTFISDEEKELAEIKIRFLSHPKLSRWVDLYFDKENVYQLGTYLNKMLSAAYAYGLDINNPEAKQRAYQYGSVNSSKVKYWAQRYYEMTGMTKEKVLDLIAERAVKGQSLALKMLASIMEIYEEKPNTLIQHNTQVTNDERVQVTPEQLAEQKKEFIEFMDWKFRIKPTTSLEET